MPKKFAGENSKAVAAKARKNAVKEEETRKKDKEKEDEYWRDDDKLISKKLQRKEDQEKKKQEQLKKKAELKSLLEDEESSHKAVGKVQKTKVTRAEIQAEVERNAATVVKKKEDSHLEQPLEENINRLEVEGLEARNIEEAISILSVNDPKGDFHPEKRLKAAFTAFEEANMPRIKNENPTLRLSQLKQILKKEWMKSPDNPLNKRD